MPNRTTTPRRRIPVLNVLFGATLGVYIFFIGGIIVADLLYVAGTRRGQSEFKSLLLSRIPTDAELETMSVKERAYFAELKRRRKEVAYAFWLSIWTSVVAAAIALVISVPAGYVLSRGRFPGVRLVDALVDVPIVLPPLVFGISLLVLFQRTFIGPGLESLGLRFVHDPKGIVLVQVLIAAAYGTRMLKGTFDSVDPRLSAVALTLGSSRARAFFTVTLSIARSGVVAALVMIWARALALYGPVIAFAGTTSMHTEVMPTRMYLEMNIGQLEAALLLALAMIAMAVVVLLVLKLAVGRTSDRTLQMLRL